MDPLSAHPCTVGNHYGSFIRVLLSALRTVYHGANEEYALPSVSSVLYTRTQPRNTCTFQCVLFLFWASTLDQHPFDINTRVLLWSLFCSVCFFTAGPTSTPQKVRAVPSVSRRLYQSPLHRSTFVLLWSLFCSFGFFKAAPTSNWQKHLCVPVIHFLAQMNVIMTYITFMNVNKACRFSTIQICFNR